MMPLAVRLYDVVNFLGVCSPAFRLIPAEAIY